MSEPGADPALRRALLAARDKRERRGASGDGRVVVSGLSTTEALALDALLTPRKPILAGARLSVALSTFEEALRSQGYDTLGEYERVAGAPVRDLPAEREASRDARAEFVTWLEQHELSLRSAAVRRRLLEAARQGRIGTETCDTVQRALRIVTALPCSTVTQRTVLAAELLDGDPHALDPGTPLHGLAVSLVGALLDIDPAAVGHRAVWAAANVLVDPVSSNVAALNLPLGGDEDASGVAARIAAAAAGSHVILTFGQLAATRLVWPDRAACFSCENPSVLIAAERALGPNAPPLICTGGRPSDAVRLLFAAVARAGGTIHHHGDFDEAGVQILRDLEARYGARPWRFDLASWERQVRRAGLAGEHPSPTGAATLEDVTRERTIAEELVLGELLDDLRAATRASSHLPS